MMAHTDIRLVAGSRGMVGSAVLSKLRERGDHVVGFDLRSPDPVDLTNPEMTKTAVQDALQRTGGTHVRSIFICTGAMLPENSGLADFEWSALLQTLELNLKPMVTFIQASLPHMYSGDSSIVGVGSTTALFSAGNLNPGYSAAKSAEAVILRELSILLAKTSVRVNWVTAGPMKGGLLAPSEVDGVRVSMTPTGRLVSAEEVAEAMIRISEIDRSIVGQGLVIDGGMTSSRHMFEDPHVSD